LHLHCIAPWDFAVVEMENNGGIMVVLPLFPFLFLIFCVFIFCFYYSFSLASVFLVIFSYPLFGLPLPFFLSLFSLVSFFFFFLFCFSPFSFLFFSLFFLSVHLLKSPPFCVSPSYIYKGERKGGRGRERERESHLTLSNHA
jgi:hypothetical protein